MFPATLKRITTLLSFHAYANGHVGVVPTSSWCSYAYTILSNDRAYFVWVIREFKKTTTATATRRSLNEMLNENDWSQGKQWVLFPQNSLFPLAPVIKCFVIPPNSKLEKKLRRNRLLYACWVTNLPWFQGARPDHVRVESSGAIHSTKISGNFGLKLNGSVRSNRKRFEKSGPPFEVDHFSRLDRSIWPFPFSPPVPRCSVFSMFNKEENTYHCRFHGLLTAVYRCHSYIHVQLQQVCGCFTSPV